MDDLEDRRSVSSNDDPEYHILEDDFFNDNLTTLIKSKDPKDKEILNQMFIKSAEENRAGIYIILISNDYQLQVLNDKGQTALHLAFYHDSHDIMEYAIDHDETVEDVHINYKDCNGLTHLHIACHYYSEASDRLAEKYLEGGADVNARFENDPEGKRSGFTPLHMSVNGRIDFIDTLLEYGADVNAKDKSGRTALHLLCGIYKRENEIDENMEILELLLKNDSDANAKDNDGNTPLHNIFLGDKSYFSTEEMYLKYKTLCDYGADVTAINNTGDTILHYVVKNLKSSRSNLESPTFDDSIHIKIIDDILSTHKEIDVNAKNNAGETILQIAISMLSLDIARYLIKRNAEISEITLNKSGHHCFYNSTLLLNLETVKKAIDIIDLLLEEQFNFTPDDKLAFMKFLLQDDRKDSWLKHRDYCGYVYEHYLENLLNFGSSIEVKRVYKQIALTFLYKERNHLKNKMFKYAKNLYRQRIKAGIYYDYKCIGFFNIYDIVLKNVDTYYLDRPNLTRKIENDIAIMKNTSIYNHITVYDIMKMHPHDIYQLVKDVDFCKIISELSIYKSIVDGHVTKSLARNCVEKLANDFLKKLLFPAFPDICCKMVFFYLDNEDVLNVCSSVIL